MLHVVMVMHCVRAVIKGGLDPVAGTAVWHPTDLVPTATYQVRAFVVSISPLLFPSHSTFPFQGGARAGVPTRSCGPVSPGCVAYSAR